MELSIVMLFFKKKNISAAFFDQDSILKLHLAKVNKPNIALEKVTSAERTVRTTSKKSNVLFDFFVVLVYFEPMFHF